MEAFIGIIVELFSEILGYALIVLFFVFLGWFVRMMSKTKHFKFLKYFPTVLASIVSLLLISFTFFLIFFVKLDRNDEWFELSLLFIWFFRIILIIVTVRVSLFAYALFLHAKSEKGFNDENMESPNDRTDNI